MPDFEKVIEYYGKEDFEAVLTEELEKDPYALPLGDFCDDGGFPDEEDLECTVVDIKNRKGIVTISVRCAFTELVPTGCADVNFNGSASAEFDVVLELA